MDTFSKRLKNLREEKALSMLELGRSIGVSDASICKWENGVSEAKHSYILKLAKFFDVSTDYLLGRSDDLGAVNIPYGEPLLAPDEKELIELFRSMPDGLKEITLNTVASLAGKSLSGTTKKKA